ncbi:MAG: M50 family metallopeptidase [Chloroflexota bacterium]
MIFDAGINILTLLVILVTLVVLHELGHFVVARLAGVRVHEFGIGFPPRAAILHRGKETVYSLNWLPIGGFVRLEGEDGESEDPRSFVRQPLHTRLLILLAGVAMNFLLAWGIFTFIAATGDPVVGVRVSFVQPGSPAASIGLVGGTQVGTTDDGVAIYDETGDLIIAIDGQHFPVFANPANPSDPALSYLRAHAGETVTLTVRHQDGHVQDLTVTLRSPEEATNGALGIGIQTFTTDDTVQHPIADAVGIGFQRTVDAATLILRGLQDLLRNLANPPVQGPVGMVDTVGAYRTQLPPVFLLWLVGVLSANLAVVNALPLPPLDGGRAAMAILKRLFGTRISPLFEQRAYLIGWLGLMGFLVWITMFDIRRLGGGG